MTVEEIKVYCRNKHKVTEEFPFGDVPICYKLNGKIFAQLYPYEYDYKITLKCTVDAGQFYRMMYPGKVVRGYHCPRFKRTRIEEHKKRCCSRYECHAIVHIENASRFLSVVCMPIE